VATVDNRVVDGAVNGVGRLVQRIAEAVRLTQSGAVRTYAAGVGVGVVALLIWFVLRGVVL
jgi:NADH-quinone oxidoreductase subunit L